MVYYIKLKCSLVSSKHLPLLVTPPYHLYNNRIPVITAIGSRQIFGGIFYSKKVKAVVGKRESKIYANIGGVRYTDGRRFLCMMRICIYMKFVKNVP